MTHGNENVCKVYHVDFLAYHSIVKIEKITTLETAKGQKLKVEKLPNYMANYTYNTKLIQKNKMEALLWS